MSSHKKPQNVAKAEPNNSIPEISSIQPTELYSLL